MRKIPPRHIKQKKEMTVMDGILAILLGGIMSLATLRSILVAVITGVIEVPNRGSAAYLLKFDAHPFGFALYLAVTICLVILSLFLTFGAVWFLWRKFCNGRNPGDILPMDQPTKLKLWGECRTREIRLKQQAKYVNGDKDAS